MITLRNYQAEALRKIIWSLTLEGNSLCVLPTGAGKSILISKLAHTLGKPVLILQPTREILKQNYDKLSRYVDKKEIGIYSASLMQKEIAYYTLATIQSIYRKPEYFKHFGIVIIDECDLVNPRNLQGMFTRFLAAIGNPRCVGFTATPFRMQSLGRNQGFGIKLINRTREFFWQRIIYNISTRTLTEQGYLCPLTYLDMSVIEQHEIPVNKSGTDFDLTGYEEKIAGKQKQIYKIIDYSLTHATSIVVFCSSVKQAESLALQTKNSAIVTAKTPAKDREEIISNFRKGKIKIVYNVTVLGIGFDHPQLDCIVLLRPTRSIRLLNQFLGRGVRIAPGKKTCLVIDATSTIKNVGRLDTIRMEKIEGKWELLSEKGSWHNKNLYPRPTEQQKRWFNAEYTINRQRRFA